MKYNGRLAITAFICGLGSILLTSLITMMIGRVGTYALAGYSVANSVMSILERLLIIPLIIAFFMQKKLLNYIALGIEGLMIILMLAIPGPMMRLFNSPDDILAYGSHYLRTTALIMFVLAGLCVLFSFVIRRRRMMFCLILAGATTILSVTLVWLTLYVFNMGLAGAAFANITQPFHVLLPLLMLNPDPDSGAGRPVPIPGQEYTKPYPGE